MKMKVLITGTSQGIGRAICQLFLDKGHEVIGFDKNEVNMISDLAVMFDFTEDMLKDWIKAVKYLLDGNMFSEDMPLEFKTAEANKFFKHK